MKIFKFKMNNQLFQIKEVSQQEMCDYYHDDRDGYYYGQTHFQTHEVWLSEEQPEWHKKETLYHELVHCYIRCFITSRDIENYDEEVLCDIASKSNNIIQEIIEEYFKNEPR